MQITVTVAEAKQNLSALIKRVEAGDVVIILRARKPVAQMISFSEKVHPEE